MKCKHTFPLQMSAIALTWFVLGVSHSPAAFDVHIWQNPAGGAASDAGNWNPAAVPEFNDDLQFNVNSTYEVIFDSQISQVRSHSYRSGTITLRMLSPHFNQVGQGGFVVGHLPGNDARVTLAEGTIEWNVPVTIGSFADSLGLLDITSGNAVFEDRSFGTTVGSNGEGGLSVLNGARYQCDNGLVAGLNPGSYGGIVVSGSDGGQYSILQTLSPQNGNVTIGDLGFADMLIQGGAQLDCAGSMFISRQIASSAFVEFGGDGTEIHVHQDFHIGHNPGVATAGDGTLTVFEAGPTSQITVDNDMFVGDPDGGLGFLSLFNSNMTISVGGNFICDPNNGSLFWDSGTLRVRGEFIPPSNNFVLNGTDPTLELDGGTASFGDRVVVGSDGAGELILSNGAVATWTAENADLHIGEGSPSNGSVVLRGPGTQLIFDQLGSVKIVAGHGELSIIDGARLDCSIVELGINRNTYAAIVDGANSEMFVERLIVVGGRPGSPGGSDGTLVVTNDGRVATADATARSHVYSGGVLSVSDDGTVDLAGELEVRGGDVVVDRGFLTVQNGIELVSGSFSGDQTIIGDLNIRAAFIEPRSTSLQSAVMQIDGSVTIDSDLATLEIQIGGLEPGAQHDQLSVSGDVQLDGTLLLQSLGEFEPQRNDEFVIVTGRDITGHFSDVVEDAVWSGLCYDIVYERQQVKIVVIGPGNDGTIDSVTVVRGVVLGGGLDELQHLDDDYLQTRSGFGSTFVDLHSTLINVVVTAEDPSDDFIDVFIEERIDRPSGISKLRLRDVNTGQFVQVVQFGINMNEQRHDAQSIDANRFMTPEGRIEIQIEHDVFVPFLAFTFQSFFDQIKVCTR